MEDDKNKDIDNSIDEAEEVNIPEGWSVLDYKIVKRLAYLEIEIHNVMAHVKKAQDITISEREWLIAHNDALDEILIRLFEVYYHVFPDRRDQDTKVRKQLAALRSKRNPDAKPE